MTEQEKQLLLIDLCARLTYNIILYDSLHDITFNEIDWFNPINNIITYSKASVPIEEVKPYLRPMSSMTNEECFEYNGLCNETADFDWEIISYKIYDWLNTHHFDYRGLIKKGLALEATEEMYKF